MIVVKAFIKRER